MYNIKKPIYLFVVALLFFPQQAFSAGSFESWLSDFRAEARSRGVTSPTLTRALADIRPIQRVLELDRKQPEGTMTFAEYRQKVVNKARIDKGRRLYKEHKILLDKIAKEYGVQPQFIVALWGIETNYGENTGGFDVIPALATLAYDGRRSEFFRDELISALKILDEGHIGFDAMKGSWAGAMGQNQFMPSSFKRFAVDYNGDGRRDIWRTLPDVFASSANYLKRNGWRAGQRWGREVTIPKNLPDNATGLDRTKTIDEWADAGVRIADGSPLPVARGVKASIVLPDGRNGPAYLVYDNYRTIMTWNKSTYFATSVGLLADAIAQ